MTIKVMVRQKLAYWTNFYRAMTAQIEQDFFLDDA